MTPRTFKTTNLRPVRLTALGAAAVLALAACSDDNEDDSSAVSGESTVETVAESVPVTEDSPTTDTTAGSDTDPTSDATDPPPTTQPGSEPAGELSQEQAGERALEEAPSGSVLEDEVYAETVDGQPAWEVDVYHPDGSDWDYYIHRETGELLDVVAGG